MMEQKINCTRIGDNKTFSKQKLLSLVNKHLYTQLQLKPEKCCKHLQLYTYLSVLFYLDSACILYTVMHDKFNLIF
jgi:hypothetical protein